jgi:hypothetical protein
MDEDGTHVARRVASLEQVSPVITAMLIDAFGVSLAVQQTYAKLIP